MHPLRGERLMTIGELIDKIMYESRLTQTQLAEKMDCTQATISRLRNNKQFPHLKMLKKLNKIAKPYKIKIDIQDIDM